MGYWNTKWTEFKARLPWIPILLGLAFLGFGRKAQRFQEAGGQLPEKTIPIALISIGVIWLVAKYFYKKSKLPSIQTQTSR